MTWGNLSAYLGRLEADGYVVIEKELPGNKPHTTLLLTDEGRNAIEEYRGKMKRVFDNLPAK
jgi:DNA-binding PadR family transcriptional regulator